MPDIAINGFPKDDKTIREVVDCIIAAMLELWGCQQERIGIFCDSIY